MSWLPMGGSIDNLPKKIAEDSITVLSSVSATSVQPEELSMLVLSATFVATYELPESGEVTIGRSQSAEIYVDDPQVSRRHASVSMAPHPMIRDLGSSNGTHVRGERLRSGATGQLAVGDVVMVGSTALMLQRGASAVRPRRFWAREHFEARLKEECARAERTKGRFSVATLHVGPDVPDVGVRQILASAVRTSDVIGECRPAVYALLIVDADARESRIVRERIAAELTEHDVSSRWGVAHFPDEGTTSEDLLTAALMFADKRRPAISSAEGRIVADAVTQELFDVAERIAAGDISVLIYGETGVGKEVMAEEIHRRSSRSSQPFVRINCAALSESLLESELFGHERGAFTSAVSAKPGLLETADGGVVLLDEIGELPMTMQVKLLRVLEDKQVRRVGGVRSHLLDVRFIAATNRDLQDHAARGLFRQDLYYRLAAATLEIPPLRKRPDDIEPLARSFLIHASRHLGVPATLSADAVAALRAYAWPGNIRELKHVIERAVLLAGRTPITLAHLALGDGRTDESPAAEPTSDDEDRRQIMDVLAACGGNQSRAAKRLGISRGALIRRLERFGIVRPRKPE